MFPLQQPAPSSDADAIALFRAFQRQGPNVSWTKTDRGVVLELRNFSPRGVEPPGNLLPALDEAALYLRQKPGRRVVITGYADKAEGADAGALALISAGRSQHVWDALARRGIATAQLLKMNSPGARSVFAAMFKSAKNGGYRSVELLFVEPGLPVGIKASATLIMSRPF